MFPAGIKTAGSLLSTEMSGRLHFLKLTFLKFCSIFLDTYITKANY
jgi:hypothetical protein